MTEKYQVDSMNKKVITIISILFVILTLGLLLYIKSSNVFNSTSDSNTYIRINEVVIDNVTGITDDDGERSDWVELYNPNDFEINLKNYSLTDDSDNPDKWVFPDITIEAKNYLIIYASGKNKYTNCNYIHTNFKLSDDGENLYLYSQNRTEIDSIDIPDDLQTNYSYGLAINKNYKYCSFTCATPGQANIAQTYKIYNEVKPLGNVKFSSESGFYDKNFYLTLSSENNDGIKIVYTLDGSEPNEKSLVYQNPILVSSDLNPNNNTNINTRVDTFSQPESIYLPKSDYKGVVIRARLIKDNCLSDTIETNTYFINPDYSLPIVSLSCNNDDLFSYDKGIYVPGLFFDIWKKYNPEVYDDWFPVANYSQDREIKGSFEYFNKEGVRKYQQDIGVQISGNASRNNACKSLELIAKKKYSENPKFEFDFFGGTVLNKKHEPITKYKSIVLRNSGNDFNKTMFLDAFVQNIAIENNIDISPQSYQPTALFINGEYWGIHNLRESHDEYYIESHYNINHNKVEKYHSFKEVFLADKNQSLGEYILSCDLSDDKTFDYLSSIIDIDNLANYLAFEIFIANTDWPIGNLLMWRSTSFDENNSYEDGKLRMILYDVDCGFSDYKNDSFDRFLNIDEKEINDVSNIAVIGTLMKNKTFRELFLSKIESLTDNVFVSKNVCKQIDVAASKIDSEITKHFERWNYSNIIHLAYLKYKRKSDPPIYNTWIENVKELKDFANNRPQYIQKYLLKYFDE